MVGFIGSASGIHTFAFPLGGKNVDLFGKALLVFVKIP